MEDDIALHGENMQVGKRKADLCVGKAGMEQMLP